jgi:hypothetical protein
MAATPISNSFMILSLQEFSLFPTNISYKFYGGRKWNVFPTKIW